MVQTACDLKVGDIVLFGENAEYGGMENVIAVVIRKRETGNGHYIAINAIFSPSGSQHRYTNDAANFLYDVERRNVKKLCSVEL